MADAPVPLNSPVLVKRMLIARPIGEYVNGPKQHGNITRERLAALVEKQKKYPRQIPIYLLGDHPATNDQRPADGYAENLSTDAQGNLYADPAKLVGTAAEWVANDRIRGASIYTFQATDYNGEPIGECLKHVLLSDEAFMRDINVAAHRAGGAGVVGIGFTAFKEAAMADKNRTLPAKAEIEDEKALALINHHEEEVVKLKAELIGKDEQIDTLQKQLDNKPVDTEKESLALRVAVLERKTQAQDIRELVSKGLQRGTLKASWCQKYNEGGDEGTISWFKASERFGTLNADGSPDLRLLKYQVEQTEPVVKLNQRFATGAPGDAPTPTLSSEDKASLRARGLDPEKGAIAAKVAQVGGDLSTYRRLRAEQKGA